MIDAAELRGALLIGASCLAVIAVAEAWIRFGTPRPEWTRKLVHTGGGLACLFMPFLLRSPWTVLALAVGFGGLLAAGGKFGFLRCTHSVERKGKGSEFYPLAVFLVFWLCHDRPALYLSSILTLAVADALAALIGSQYGVIRYELDQEWKSLEGSLTFLVVTFLVVHLPTLLMTDVPRVNCVLAATLVALLVTLIEALSPWGTDNLFVPFAVFAILDRTLGRGVEELATYNAMLLATFAAIALLAWRTRAFNTGGTLALVLFTFLLWSLGSGYWALPIFAGYVFWMGLRLLVPPPDGRPAITRVRTVSRALMAPMLVFLAAYITQDETFFYGPYLATSIAILAFTLWNFALGRWTFVGWQRPIGALLAAGIAWLVNGGLTWWLDDGASLNSLRVIGLTIVPLALANDHAIGPVPTFETDRLWPTHRLLLTCLAAGITVALQAAGWLPVWVR